MDDTELGYPENDPDFQRAQRQYEAEKNRGLCDGREWNEQGMCNDCGTERRQVR